MTVKKFAPVKWCSLFTSSLPVTIVSLRLGSVPNLQFHFTVKLKIRYTTPPPPSPYPPQRITRILMILGSFFYCQDILDESGLQLSKTMLRACLYLLNAVIIDSL